MITMEASLKETTNIIAGVDLRCVAVQSNVDLQAFMASAHFIGVRFSGLRNGALTLIVPTNAAFDLAQRILSTATGSEFAKDQLDISLINNTLGELANMAAGHYLRSNGLASSSQLFAPKLLTAGDVSSEIERGTGLILCEYQTYKFEAIFQVA